MLNNDNPIVARIKELKKMKHRLLTQMRRQRKHYAKNLAKKKQVNSELKKLKQDMNIFSNMSKEDAFKKVHSEISSVRPEDIYPSDLEKEFDIIERNAQTMTISGRPDEDDDDPDGEVMDFSQDPVEIEE